MIDVLEINNFKSVKQLELNCRRLNIFIGQPNAGKSNILESLGLISFLRYSQYNSDFDRFVRFERTGNLFYDEALDVPVEIAWDAYKLRLGFENGGFQGTCQTEQTQMAAFEGDHTGLKATSPGGGRLTPFKFYRFADNAQWPRLESSFLLPPSGENLVNLLLPRTELRSLVSDLFAPFGLRLGIRPQEGKLELIKQFEDIIVSYPFQVISETLRRMVFYLAAILSNKDSVLVFEEPESHAFPYYTKYLAEIIALDENSNQYFISTHNPYFLVPILEKSPKDQVGVFLTYFEDYETKVKVLGEEDLQRLGEMDIFSNLEAFLD